jgi:glucose-6-phosphate 1-dehydrogenase
MRLEVDSWRWQGVPFFIRTGKRLPLRVTHILVSFRHPPICMFKPYSGCQIQSNKLLITLQPDEGFHLYFDVKEPEKPLKVRTEKLHFHYQEAFGPLPEAYRTLILDVIQGDQTLFVRSDEVEASWELFTPLIESERTVFPYPAGTWGPKEADQLSTRYGKRWWNQ